MKRSLIVTFVMTFATAAFLMHISTRPAVAVVDNRLEELPASFEGWAGEDRYFEDRIYQELNADANLYRVYSHEDHGRVWLYIGYYGTEKGGRAAHQPQYCYPGSGWDIVEIGKERLETSRGPIEVSKIIVQRGDVRNVALYWNHSGRQEVLTSGWKMNVNRLLRRITENRDDGAFVRISAIVDERGLESVVKSEKAFARNLLEVLPKYWPIEEESESGGGMAGILDRIKRSYAG